MAWKRICSLEDIPKKSIKEFNIEGIPLLVVRGNENYLVTPPFCPHMREPLINGICDGVRLTCTAHLWQFDLETGEPLGEAERGLLLYETKEEDDGIYADLTEELLYDYQMED